jgi:VanZ family protein
MIRHFKWVPVIVYCALIFYLISMSMPEQMPSSTWADKFYHILMFIPLGYLLMYVFMGYVTSGTLKCLVTVVLTAAAYGALTEIYQAFTPARTPDILDAAMNFAGSALGAFFFILVTNYHELMAKRLSRSR